MVDGIKHLRDVAPFTLGALDVVFNDGQAFFIVLRYSLAAPEKERVEGESPGVPLGGYDHVKRIHNICLRIEYLKCIDW